MLKNLATAAVVAAVLMLMWRSSSPAPVPPPAPEQVPAAATAAVVDRIVDGDTIWVRAGPSGQVEKIRILEIDTPELNPGGEPECWSAEAVAFARAELPVGSTVHLLADKEDEDQYGRSLRYVWDSEGEFFNEKVVAQGHARSLLVRPNDLYITQIRQAEVRAREEGLGLWGGCPR